MNERIRVPYNESKVDDTYSHLPSVLQSFYFVNPDDPIRCRVRLFDVVQFELLRASTHASAPTASGYCYAKAPRVDAARSHLGTNFSMPHAIIARRFAMLCLKRPKSIITHLVYHLGRQRM
jgi:hypothetical protein